MQLNLIVSSPFHSGKRFFQRFYNFYAHGVIFLGRTEIDIFVEDFLHLRNPALSERPRCLNSNKSVRRKKSEIEIEEQHGNILSNISMYASNLRLLSPQGKKSLPTTQRLNLTLLDWLKISRSRLSRTIPLTSRHKGNIQILV